MKVEYTELNEKTVSGVIDDNLKKHLKDATVHFFMQQKFGQSGKKLGADIMMLWNDHVNSYTDDNLIHLKFDLDSDNDQGSANLFKNELMHIDMLVSRKGFDMIMNGQVDNAIEGFIEILMSTYLQKEKIDNFLNKYEKTYPMLKDIYKLFEAENLGMDFNDFLNYSLLDAAKEHDMELARFLIDNGANPNVVDHGHTPMAFAVIKKDVEMINTLKEKGAYNFDFMHPLSEYNDIMIMSLNKTSKDVRGIFAPDYKRFKTLVEESSDSINNNNVQSLRR